MLAPSIEASHSKFLNFTVVIGLRIVFIHKISNVIKQFVLDICAIKVYLIYTCKIAIHASYSTYYRAVFVLTNIKSDVDEYIEDHMAEFIDSFTGEVLESTEHLN